MVLLWGPLTTAPPPATGPEKVTINSKFSNAVSHIYLMETGKFRYFIYWLHGNRKWLTRNTSNGSFLNVYSRT